MGGGASITVDMGRGASLTSLKHQDAGTRGVGLGEELEDEGRGDLVGGVADADVEGREGGLDDVAEQDLELPLLGLPLHALGDLGGHARVHLHGDDLLRLFQDPHRQVARPRTHLQHRVRRLQPRFVDDLLRDSRVLEDICGVLGLTAFLFFFLSL